MRSFLSMVSSQVLPHAAKSTWLPLREGQKYATAYSVSGCASAKRYSKLEVKTSESWECKPPRLKTVDLEVPCPHGLQPEWDSTQEIPAFGFFIA